MKEYLLKTNYGYGLITAENAEGEGVLGVSEGMNFAWMDEDSVWFTKDYMDYRNSKVIWQRETLNDKVASAEEYRQSETEYLMQGKNGERLMKSIEQFKNTDNGKDFDDFELIDDEPKEKHSHYKKDVSHLNILDPYRISDLYDLHPCADHIMKKSLCAGGRGHKDLLRDIQDMIDTAERWKQMVLEDANSSKD